MSVHGTKTAALLAYDAGVLSSEGVRRLERHLSRCAQCNRALASVRAYQRISQEVQATEIPAIDWAKMERTLEVEARAQKERIAASRVAWWSTGALAAAAAIAFMLVPLPLPSAPVARRDVPQPAIVAERPLAEGAVMLVAGQVTLGDGSAVAIGTTIREGMTIRCANRSEVNVRFKEGTGALLSENTSAIVTELREGQVRLALEDGTVSNQVQPLAQGDRYQIAAGPWLVKVRGTRFAVSRANGSTVRVTVTEGTVDIENNGRVVRTLVAPGGWSSTPGTNVNANADVAVRSVYGLEHGSFEWPVLRLPAVSWVTHWQVDARRIDTRGPAQMRVRPDEIGISAIGVQGQEWRQLVTVHTGGFVLEGAAVRPNAPAVRTGELPLELIRPVVNAGRERLRQCWERASRDEPYFRAQFRVRLTVGLLGEVENVRVLSDDNPLPASFTECVVTQVRNWHFPPPTGGIVPIEVPLRFAGRQ